MKRYSSILLVLVAFAFCAKTAYNAFGIANFTVKMVVASDLTESEESEESAEDEAGEDTSIAGVEPMLLVDVQAPQAASTVHDFPLLTFPHEILSPPPQA